MTLAISAVAPVLLAAYAALLLWRTAVERGYVGESPPLTPLQAAVLRLGSSIRLAFAAMGAALSPVMRNVTEAIGEWQATMDAVEAARAEASDRGSCA